MTDTITSTADVATDRAPRYGKQLVSHLGRRSIGSWDADSASGSLEMNNDAARVTLTCSSDTLHIEIRSTTADIASYEDVVGRHLVRFGERDELRVQWVRSDGFEGSMHVGR